MGQHSTTCLPFQSFDVNAVAEEASFLAGGWKEYIANPRALRLTKPHGTLKVTLKHHAFGCDSISNLGTAPLQGPFPMLRWFQTRPLDIQAQVFRLLESRITKTISTAGETDKEKSPDEHEKVYQGKDKLCER